MGNNAYKLQLPTTMKIHNTFNGTLLEKHHQNTNPDNLPLDIQTINKHMEISKILDLKILDRRTLFLNKSNSKNL